MSSQEFNHLPPTLPPWSLPDWVENLLVIPDWHQNVEFVKNVIKKEKGNFNYILTLGDEFDARGEKGIVGAKETAEFALELQKGEKYGPCSQLLGNHNLGYLESWRVNQKFRSKRELVNKCGGFSKGKSIKINNIYKWENWLGYKLFVYFGGFLFSHAGFHPGYWVGESGNKGDVTVTLGLEDKLNSLYEEFTQSVQLIEAKPHRLFSAGRARGGDSPYGGPLWLDFDEEFEDSPALPPQIVGHTRNVKNKVRKKGRSYCIDGGQSSYALVRRDGSVRFEEV